MKKHILITDPIHPTVLNGLQKQFVVDQKIGLSKEQLLRIVGNYDALIGRTTTKLDAEVLRAGKNLTCIGVHATGWNHIDIEEATRLGITVLGFPSDNKQFKKDRLRGSFIGVAEHVLLSMLACAGDFYNTVAGMKAGKWEKYKFSGTELYGKTLGIVGLGRIGSLVAERARAFGMRVVAYHPRLSKQEAKRRGAELVSLKTLYRVSDFITVHVPQTVKTVGLINKKSFSEMKKGVVFINTARAAVVVEKDLIEALENGVVRMASIDVFEHSPKGVNQRLVRMKNVLATPHIAGISQEGLERVSSYIGKSVSDYLISGKKRGSITSPKKTRRAVQNV